MLFLVADQTERTADLRRALELLSQRQYEVLQAVHQVHQQTDAEIAVLREREQRAVDDFERQLAELVAAEAALEAVLAQPDSGADMFVRMPNGDWGAVQVKAAREAPTSDNTPTSTRGAILRLLASDPRPFETHEIVERVPEFGADSQAATTRSILAKMHKRGEVEQVKRGVYRRRHGSLSRTVRRAPSGSSTSWQAKSPSTGSYGRATSKGRYHLRTEMLDGFTDVDTDILDAALGDAPSQTNVPARPQLLLESGSTREEKSS